MNQMELCAGFFPPTEENLTKFAELMLLDSSCLDALAVFKAVEHNINNIIPYIPENTKFFSLISFDSFFYGLLP